MKTWAPQDQSQRKPCATRRRISLERFTAPSRYGETSSLHITQRPRGLARAGGRYVCAAVSFVAPEGAATAERRHKRWIIIRDGKKLTLLVFPQGELLHLDLWRNTSCKNNGLLFTLYTPGGGGLGSCKTSCQCCHPFHLVLENRQEAQQGEAGSMGLMDGALGEVKGRGREVIRAPVSDGKVSVMGGWVPGPFSF